MLKTPEFMRDNALIWYYPGYVIVGRPKFDYKLFLGKESTEYYDPETETWKPYTDEILKPELRTEDGEHLLYNVYFPFQVIFLLSNLSSFLFHLSSHNFPNLSS